MKVLIAIQPLVGSLNPLLPVAAAFRARGHDVALSSSAFFRPRAELHGFPYLDAGYRDAAELEERLREAPARPPATAPWREQAIWYHRYVAADAIARATVRDMAPLIERWAPRLIVRDALMYGAAVAAEMNGLPHVAVAADALSPLAWVRQEIEPQLARLRAESGLTDGSGDEMSFRHLLVHLVPHSFDDPEARLPATTRHVRHDHPPQIGKVPASVERAERPVVLASLGTLAPRHSRELLSSIVEAFAGASFELVLAVGLGQDVDSLGPVPPNVHVVRYVAQVDVLRRCTAFVTHAGFTSVKEAMTLGVPMVALPINGDHPYIAGRCAALGIAEELGPSDRDPTNVRAAVERVVEDASYRAAAANVSAEMAALPEMARAVRWAERIADVLP